MVLNSDKSKEKGLDKIPIRLVQVYKEDQNKVIGIINQSIRLERKDNS